MLRHAELVSASIPPPNAPERVEEWILKQVQDDGLLMLRTHLLQSRSEAMNRQGVLGD
jgi:hypothetical protein